MACPAQSCDNFALPEVLCLGLQQARRIDRVQLTTGIPDTMLLLLLLLLLHAACCFGELAMHCLQYVK